MESPRLHPLTRPILLIEDNPMDVDLARQAFRDEQIQNPVAVCRDGEEALQYIDAHPSPADLEVPLIAMLDLRLPKIDGFDVLRHARAHPTWKQVPFIAFTTSRHADDVTRAYELGVNSYIVKPVDFTSFAEIARTIKSYWLMTNQPPFQDGTN